MENKLLVIFIVKTTVMILVLAMKERHTNLLARVLSTDQKATTSLIPTAPTRHTAWKADNLTKDLTMCESC